jgi:hypothetical protein
MSRQNSEYINARLSDHDVNRAILFAKRYQCAMAQVSRRGYGCADTICGYCCTQANGFAIQPTYQNRVHPFAILIDGLKGNGGVYAAVGKVTSIPAMCIEMFYYGSTGYEFATASPYNNVNSFEYLFWFYGRYLYIRNRPGSVASLRTVQVDSRFRQRLIDMESPPVVNDPGSTIYEREDARVFAMLNTVGGRSARDILAFSPKTGTKSGNPVKNAAKRRRKRVRR